MATEAVARPTRRRWLLLAPGWAAAAWSWAGIGPASPAGASVAATWQLPTGGHQLGLLALVDGQLQPTACIDLPTRAHGVVALPDGALLAVARRPGDWLLRWSPRSGAADWAWAEPDRAFNGHALLSSDGRRLFTTEARLDTGDSLVGVRHAATLEKTAEWPTHGRDAHHLLWDGAGQSLLVANGGILTRPESGRAKLALDRMDSSLVRLHAGSGALQGQWRLPDARLSLRHLAWTGSGADRRLGIALQAEHDAAAQREGAPVLALFDGQRLDAPAPPRHLDGYGGDIAGTPDGFAVSCPRAGGVARFDGAGRWRGWLALAEACALSTSTGRHARALWAGGLGQARVRAGTRDDTAALAPGLRLDNHWLAG